MNKSRGGRGIGFQGKMYGEQRRRRGPTGVIRHPTQMLLKSVLPASCWCFYSTVTAYTRGEQRQPDTGHYGRKEDEARG